MKIQINEIKRMQQLAGIINEDMFVNDNGELIDTDKRWAFYINSEDDWDILSNLLDKNNYRFASGYTFSKYKLTDFNPFKSERAFGDKGEDDNDQGYSYAMSYEGKPDLILLQMPNKKLQIVNPSYFNSRKNSTYKNYTLYKNLIDIFKIINL